VDASPYLISHLAAARLGTTTQQLAAWARQGWIERHIVGTRIYYAVTELDRLIESRRERAALTQNITPISDALREAREGFGIRKVGP
jgi:hypothetical protein